METSKIYRIMRLLHRDIGFLVIGLTMIYSISGILLTYRESDFLKSEKMITKTVESGLRADSLGRILHKKVEVLGEDSGVVAFKIEGNDGTYNQKTDELSYKDMVLPVVLDKFNALHKTSDKKETHWFTVTYAVLLMFLALSSYWMYKPKTRAFKRGLVLSAVGLIGAALLLIVV